MKNTTPTLTDVQARALDMLSRSLEAAQHLAEQIRITAEERAHEVRETVESAFSTTAQQAREAAEPTADQVSAAVDELIEWAEANRDRVVVDLTKARNVLEDRFAARAIVTKADLDVLEARVAAVEKSLAGTPAKKAPARKPAAKKASARKPATASTKTAPARKPATAKKG